MIQANAFAIRLQQRFGRQNVRAFVLGAIPFVVTVSKTIGGTVPVLLKKTGVDPAMAAGPIVTTVVDLVGFFTVLMLASLMIEKLLQ